MARTGGSSLTTNQTLVIEALTDGEYFVDFETPSGTQNGTNLIFTLLSNPTPASSLTVMINGQVQIAGGTDYSLSSATITFVAGRAPASDDVLRCSYRTSPV